MSPSRSAHADPQQARRGWRTLAAFWVLLLSCGGVAAAILQLLGPPPGQPERQAATTSVSAPVPAAVSAPPAHAASRAPGQAIAPPVAGLLEPAKDYAGASLPRKGAGANGMPTVPMAAYAGGFDPADTRPRVALLLSGMGGSAASSDDAVARLPAGVTLAYSPYAPRLDFTQARARGHEIVLAVPMEPAGYPLEDEGPEALLTGASAAENGRRLEWAMSRFQGYAGVTGALGDLHGGRFAVSASSMATVLDELSARGLYYIDPGSDGPQRKDDAARSFMIRRVDLVVDPPDQPSAIAAKLDALTRLAYEHGPALGLAGVPRPVTIDRIASWADGLAGHGVVLVPVSALFAASGPPHTQGAAR